MSFLNDRALPVPGIIFVVREKDPGRTVLLQREAGDCGRKVGDDAVFIDGAYMLRSAQPNRARWEMNMEVMESLKQFAMAENIAIISTFQFDQKQRLKNLSTIMGGQAIGQLASVVIGIENEIDNNNRYSGISYKELTLYKGREGETGKIRLKYDMNRTIIEQDSVIEGTQELEDEILNTTDMDVF